MLQNERTNDYLLSQVLAGDETIKGVWKALPGVVDKYYTDPADPLYGCADVQIAVTLKVRQEDQTWQPSTIKECLGVPVCFPGGGGFDIRCPLKAGDDVLLIFTDRDFSRWWAYGGVQPQDSERIHNFSDAIAIPRPRTKVSVPGCEQNPGPPISATRLQIRTDDGRSMFEMDPSDDNAQVRMSAPGGVVIEGVLFKAGVATFPEGGNASWKKAGGPRLSFLGHEHPGVHGETGPPNAEGG